MPELEQVCDDATMARSAKKKSRRDALLDDLLKEYGGSDGVTGPEGLLKQLTRAVINRAMGAELSHHLGYEEGEAPPDVQDNRRNGKSAKHYWIGIGAWRQKWCTWALLKAGRVGFSRRQRGQRGSQAASSRAMARRAVMKES